MALDNYSNFNINSIMFEEEYLSQIDNFNDVDKERGKANQKLVSI